MTVIKLQLKTDIRRITVDKLPNYEDLNGLVKGLFGSALPNKYVLKYKDEEGDVISVTTDRELVEAFVVMKNQIARFTIEEVTAPTSAKTSTDPNTIELDLDLGSNLGETIQNLIQSFQGAYSRRFQNPNNNSRPAPGQQVHHGVTCDGCNAYPVIGNRYKCTVCPDYDLCESCHSQEKHKEHALNKVESSPFGRCHWARGHHGGPFAHRAICDNCQTRIVGTRFKCNVCEDYDLCEKCEKLKVHAPEHTFTAISRPVCPRRAWNHCKTEDSKSEESKPAETKTEEKPVEAEVKAETAEVKAEEVKTEEKPVEVEVKPVVVVEEPKPVVVEKPVEVKPVEPVHPFADKIDQLTAMGFFDVDRNIALLLKHKGDLVKAVSDLL